MPLGIYVHIPFCVRKCLYCDFLSFPAGEEEKSAYVEALLREIDGAAAKFGIEAGDAQIGSIYIGGGTPGCLDTVYINKILCKLDEIYGPFSEATEITIEINPAVGELTKLKGLSELGINRLSIGLQSANEDELRLLGRIHDREAFKACFESAREAGFSNINVDIMTALPGQTGEKLNNTLCMLKELSPEHISAYSLIIEEGTPFYDMYTGEGEKLLPSEEEERSLYWQVRDTLTGLGYGHYEISNFAKPGFESRHNTSYWKRIPYLGLGLGASGLINETRYKNTDDMRTYLRASGERSSIAEALSLSGKDRMEETMFLGLRMREGVSMSSFYADFGVSLREIYGEELERLRAQGLISILKDRVFLTDKGTDYGNYVFSRFLL